LTLLSAAQAFGLSLSVSQASALATPARTISFPATSRVSIVSIRRIADRADPASSRFDSDSALLSSFSMSIGEV
jgi:hypothetical protein